MFLIDTKPAKQIINVLSTKRKRPSEKKQQYLLLQESLVASSGFVCYRLPDLLKLGCWLTRKSNETLDQPSKVTRFPVCLKEKNFIELWTDIITT